MSRFMLAVVLVASLSASALIATAASKPITKPKKVAAAIKGTATAPTAGACTLGTSFAATCPGTVQQCTCISLTGEATGALGKGPIVGFLTLDNSDETPEDGCTPFFGSIAITNNKDSNVDTLDVTGALCSSTPPGGTQTVGGGFDFDPATVGLDGTGAVSGTIDSAGNAKLKLTGVIAPAASPSPSASPSGSATPTEVATPTDVPTPTDVATPTEVPTPTEIPTPSATPTV